MNRKRALIADTFCLTKRRRCAADSVTGDGRADGSADIRSSLQYLMTLFSRKLFNDSLPPVVLKHQLYSLHDDKTSVDKQVNELRRTKFLAKLTPGCSDLSFNKEKMLKEFLFADSEITQLVKSGVLTVRDAGSWWLSIPNSGRFIKYFVKGRKAVLGMVKEIKCGEVLRTELEGRRTTSQVKFQMKYHVHDIIGAELVERVQTTSGTLLRYMEGNVN
ncbi:serine/threonine-protein kinase 19-like [Puntigrus tetrazona]|uniref:serine/threonine-protein kinase 19-like n=1 Tax=Puntigrus tetrazona TaxID=1606681 RepID=UPI001C8A9AA9|nr:serine/threonine-protein kinase 19-like [Puntigrus tetrazona]